MMLLLFCLSDILIQFKLARGRFELEYRMTEHVAITNLATSDIAKILFQ